MDLMTTRKPLVQPDEQLPPDPLVQKVKLQKKKEVYRLLSSGHVLYPTGV
jgi:hypothetical protein